MASQVLQVELSVDEYLTLVNLLNDEQRRVKYEHLRWRPSRRALELEELDSLEKKLQAEYLKTAGY